MYFDRCVGKSNVPWLRGLIFLTALIWANSAYAADTDIRTGSVSCVLDKSGQNVECDYRYPATLDIKEVSLAVADKAVQIPPKGLSNYPAYGQSTAILIMVDVSDSRRKNTVEKKNVPAVLEMLTSQQPHHKVGIGVFDSDLRILSPISVDLETTRNSVKDIKAGGQSTEFYKSILAGIDHLQRTEATRKGLIVFSDGKDEDQAYRHSDVIKAAEGAGVAILGMGYLERSVDSPYLQNIKRLADETYGLYYDSTNEILPYTLVGNPFSFVEKGGRVSFALGAWIGKQEIAIILGTDAKKQISLKTQFEFPDRRTAEQKALDFVKEFWIFLLTGFAVFTLGAALVIRRRRRNKSELSQPIDYAFLHELDGTGTIHALTKTAVCIGRSANNDIRLTNDSISSHHAEIHRRREGDFYIVDLASTNGIHVNEAKVTQMALNEGDLIELGEVRLRFSINPKKMYKPN
jgi:hypothetical protein